MRGSQRRQISVGNLPMTGQMRNPAHRLFERQVVRPEPVFWQPRDFRQQLRRVGR